MIKKLYIIFKNNAEKNTIKDVKDRLQVLSINSKKNFKKYIKHSNVKNLSDV